MIHNAGEKLAVNRGEPAAESAERLSPMALGRVLSITELVEQCRWEIQTYRRGEPCAETSSLELLRRAIEQGDQDAWAGVQQCLGEIVLGWLRVHPNRVAAYRWESEENYVALAFERFWQATVGHQVVFKTFAGALVYLRASLNGGVLDTLRAYSRPREVSLPESGAPGEPTCEDSPESFKLWEILQRVLPSESERRLAYLLYHCNLKPREIVHFCPEEWPDVQEIYRMRRNILERLMRQRDQLRWWFHLQEQG